MDPSNPYQPPESPVSQLKPLGSLAQSARGKHLHQARNILLVIGTLTALANGFMLYNATNEVNNAIQAQQIDPARSAEVLGFVRLIYGATILLGVLFIVFGLTVKKFPVPITITSLILYIGSAILWGLLDPTTLAAGLIVKIIIIVALVKAIQAALAYQKERRAADPGALLT